MSATSTRLKALALWVSLFALIGGVLGTSLAGADFHEFGLEAFEAQETSSQAGMHPDFTTTVTFNHEGIGGLQYGKGVTENVSVAIPPGLVGNTNNIPPCSAGQFQSAANCPIASQVGVARVLINELEATQVITEPLYNVQAPDHEVARLGFWAVFFPIYIDVSVRTGGDYGITAIAHQTSGLTPLISAATTVWGDPADPSHDPQRLTQGEAESCYEVGTACLAPEGKRSSGLLPLPFLSNPTACEEQEVKAAATAYRLPGQVFRKSALMAPITDCESISFSPSLSVEPSSREAGAPTGLSARLRIPQTNDVNLPATSPMRDAKVTLPEGMTIAAGAADGLAACSAEQVGYEPPKSVQAEEEDPPTEAHCPEASKLGSATFVSPALDQPLHGSIYQRSPDEAPYLKAGEATQLFGLWLAIDELGLHVKIPGVIEADPNTGRLSTSFSGLPQLPVQEVDLEFKDGPRAPLKNPDSCGTYATEYEFTPWSGNAPVSGQSQMKITEGCKTPGFNPKLSAGTQSPVAGAFSPFSLTLSQESGEQNLQGLSVTLPPGLLAKPAGVELCAGQALSTGDCPSASQVGSATVATGPGPQPLWIPQPGHSPTAVYLAGPYRSAPYSLLVKVPAQAGPFDLGEVLTRVALHVDPKSAQVTATSDPLPQILKGVPVTYRTIHVQIDRPDFTLNPTSCEAMAIEAAATSAKGAKADPSSRFQVGGCGELPFKPRLALKLRGGTRRGAFPALRATYRPRAGEADLEDLLLRFPRSEFVEQGHIRTICTRVQFAAGNGGGEECPAGSVYGHIRATTPLLDQPLEGPVYLRSSNHNLPDVVFALHGQIEAEVAVRIDSVKGALRASIQGAPDVPLSKVVLQMQGAKKGLLVNSRDICARAYRATGSFTAHSGRGYEARPVLGNECGARGKGRRG